jgi:hypothetical protein
MLEPGGMMGFPGLHPQFPRPHFVPPGGGGPPEIFSLRVRGLPPDATVHDVAHYFSGAPSRPAFKGHEHHQSAS